MRYRSILKKQVYLSGIACVIVGQKMEPIHVFLFSNAEQQTKSK